VTVPITGAVVIGRNEGDRLRACLESVIPQVSHTIYVDSGSDDGSLALAANFGARIVELDTTVPFTAARARNAGWKHLIEFAGDTQFVQFVDGDCILEPSWIPRAVQELAAQPKTAVIIGHVREQWPTRNAYHRLAAMEWDTPVGEAKYCGGIALMRISALQQVNGFRDSLIAGEEPELCVRLRQTGSTVLKIDAEMALHDSNISSFAQWWRRAVRSGHAYAEGAALYGAPPDRHWLRENRSITLWGLVLPVLAVAISWPTYGASVIVAIALYLALFLKILVRRSRGTESLSSTALFAGMCVIAKWPQAVGQIVYWYNKWRRSPAKIIDYNNSATKPVAKSS
jgi:glycosyltransferase involved in cell wall biosynthesis